MKGKGPMMVIAIGISKKRKGKPMREDDDMDDHEEMEDMDDDEEMNAGGMTYAKGGMTRGGRDGCAIRGKTKGRMV